MTAARAGRPAGRPARAAGPAAEGLARRPRSLRTLLALALVAAFAVIGLTSLGVWQIERRAWKLDLIARVDRRVHAAPAPAPGPAAWPALNAGDDAYRRVAVGGRFLAGRDALVQAVTERGAGYWVLTPFQADGGFVVLIDRGFVPADAAKHIPASQATTVTGLLRMTEPGGAFLRHNDPAGGRWYSRDVAAIAGAAGLPQAAPYFIDADATAADPGAPIGGLTVIAFPNNHLVYALTWFGLALMAAGWSVFLARDEWRLRRNAVSEQNAGPRRHAFQETHVDS
ncbi:SURF1 family protein [Labrys monachus]